MNDFIKPDPTPGQELGALQRPAERCVDSDELMLGCNVVDIRHRGELYCLRVTRQGKLILTK